MVLKLSSGSGKSWDSAGRLRFQFVFGSARNLTLTCCLYRELSVRNVRGRRSPYHG